MRRHLSQVAWLAALVAAAALLAWAYPRAYPLHPHPWKLTRAEAEALALERLRDLGEQPADPYVVSRLDSDPLLETRLLISTPHDSWPALLESDLAREIFTWEVSVYAPGRRAHDWTYQAKIAPDGRILELRYKEDKDTAGGRIEEGAARAQAVDFLLAHSIDLGLYMDPVVRGEDLTSRRDTTVRFREKEQLLGDKLRYGIEVVFVGEKLGGYSLYHDDADKAAIDKMIQPLALISNFHIFSLFLILPLIVVPFVRRYHEGVIGVSRAVQIFLAILGLALVTMPFLSRSASEGWSYGVLTRGQMTFIWAFQMLIVYFVPLALVSALSWSVGESLSRERYGKKLAAFDALWQGSFRNRTVAMASLRGTALGVIFTAAAMLVGYAVRFVGGASPASLQLGPWWESARWPGVALILICAIFALYYELFGRLFLVPWLARRVGIWGGGVLAAIVTAAVAFSLLDFFPASLTLGASFVAGLFFVFVFVRFDLLTAVLADLTAHVVWGATPFLLADSGGLQLQGVIGLAGAALPLLLTMRYLASDEEFVYRYEDVPPHVRRIAERERQRVELETARNIQSSILPELPPQLAGIEISHIYRPATEVGGDFYDVLALEDGRLAIAVGDVAGHGVSSGLVMSMAKSALAVQVTFDPAIESVFGTLNRMVFQSARKRMLATLCYALLDPRRKEMTFASAGHLFPYRVSNDGRVEALESIAYPLGVRAAIDVRPHTTKLDGGDIIFLCSDGLVEAHPEGSATPFGFDRLEQSLAKLAGNAPAQVRDGVLADLDRFLGGPVEREDDLTILVLRVP